MKPKDYINKKAQEEALKAFGATQLNNNQESSDYFVGKISADRKKITDPSGKEYDLIFTGNPKEYELAQRLSDNKAVVNAQNNKTINVDGGILKPIILTKDRYAVGLSIPDSDPQNITLHIGKNNVSLQELFEDVSIKSIDKIEEDTEADAQNIQRQNIAKLSSNGKHLLILKLLFVRLIKPTVIAGVSSGGEKSRLIQGSCQAPLNCVIVETLYNDDVPATSVYTEHLQVNLASFKIYKNIRISEENELLYTDTIYEENLDDFLDLDTFPKQEFVSNGPAPTPGPLQSIVATFTSDNFSGPTQVFSVFFDFKNDQEFEILLFGTWDGRSKQITTIYQSLERRYEQFICYANPPLGGLACGTDEHVNADITAGPYLDHTYVQVFYSGGAFMAPLRNTLRGREIHAILNNNFISDPAPGDTGLVLNLSPTVHALENNASLSNLYPRAGDPFQLFSGSAYSNPFVTNDSYAAQLFYYIQEGISYSINDGGYVSLFTPDSQSNELNSRYPNDILVPSSPVFTNAGGTTAAKECPVLFNDLDTMYSFQDLGLSDVGAIMPYKNGTFICWCPFDFTSPETIPYRIKTVKKNDKGEFRAKTLIEGEFTDFSNQCIYDMALRVV